MQLRGRRPEAVPGTLTGFLAVKWLKESVKKALNREHLL